MFVGYHHFRKPPYNPPQIDGARPWNLRSYTSCFHQGVAVCERIASRAIFLAPTKRRVFAERPKKHEFWPPNGGLVKEIPEDFGQKSRLVKYHDLVRFI